MKFFKLELCFGTLSHFIMLFLLLYAQVLCLGVKAVSNSKSKCSSQCHCLHSYVDCSRKSLTSVPSDLPSWVERLDLNNNSISGLKKDSLNNFSELTELKISRNFIANIEKESFKRLVKLELLEINKNLITEINSLTFDGLNKLSELRLRHNDLSDLHDGAFWGLPNLKILKLDYNRITRVSKGWIYGLKSLSELNLSYNKIHTIEEDAWESCEDLNLLFLSFNDITNLHFKSFNHLNKLKFLKLNNNKISSIEEGAFKSLSSLEVLDLNFNHISWVVEDMSAPFMGLKELRKLNLASNKISSINQDAFLGLSNLKEINLQNNAIRTIQSNPFNFMSLSVLYMNSSSLLCECHLAWLPVWMKEHSLNIDALICAYPDSLKDKSLSTVETSKLTCADNDSPKPIIIEGPQSAVIVSGSQVNITCHATSSSNSALEFKWRKNYDEIPSLFSLKTNNSAVLHFPNVSLSHAGNYQCIVSNSYGTAYSKKANLTVLVMPTMTKTPSNVTVKAGGTARLECAAVGLPSPQVRWQKDGGTQFPAAQERRMHVMPTDDVFFIVNTKPADSGLYSCIAKNSAGTVVANSSLTVLEPPNFVNKMLDQEVSVGKHVVIDCMASGWPKPKLKWWKDGILVKPTGHIYFAANNQLLIIMNSQKSDSGCYQCEIKNLIGSEKGSMQLLVTSSVYRKSDSDMTGIIIIAVVCCAVGTSAIWVIIIYHSQKQIKNREQQLKTFSSRTNQDTRSELSASSKDSGTGDSQRSNDHLPIDSSICLQEYTDATGNIDVDSPLMTGFTLVLEEDSLHRDSNATKEHQYPCLNHDRVSQTVTNDFSPNVSSVSIDNKNNSILCVFNSSRPTSV